MHWVYFEDLHDLLTWIQAYLSYALNCRQKARNRFFSDGRHFYPVFSREKYVTNVLDQTFTSYDLAWPLKVVLTTLTCILCAVASILVIDTLLRMHPESDRKRESTTGPDDTWHFISLRVVLAVLPCPCSEKSSSCHCGCTSCPSLVLDSLVLPCVSRVC